MKKQKPLLQELSDRNKHSVHQVKLMSNYHNCLSLEVGDRKFRICNYSKENLSRIFLVLKQRPSNHFCLQTSHYLKESTEYNNQEGLLKRVQFQQQRKNISLNHNNSHLLRLEYLEKFKASSIDVFDIARGDKPLGGFRVFTLKSLE